MRYDPGSEEYDLLQQGRREVRRALRLRRHPNCRDPDHPGCPLCRDDDENEETHDDENP